MNLRNIWALALLLCSCQLLIAQENPYDIKSIKETYIFQKPINKTKFGKVPTAQLTVEEEFYTKRSSAFIYRHANTNSYTGIQEFSIKGADIKKSKPYAIPYENDEFFHTGTKLFFHALEIKKENIYTSKLVKNFYDTKYLTQVDLYHPEAECEKKSVAFEIPDDLKVDLHEMNFDGFEIEKKVEKIRGGTRYSFIRKDIKKAKNQDFKPSTYAHQPHILVVVKSYKRGKKWRPIFESTADLYAWYHRLTKKIKNRNRDLKKDVKIITEGLETDEEKIKAIYYWVQDNIQYIAFEEGLAGFKPDNCQNVSSKRYGDCKGMANLTAEMLKIAGFDARLTWVGTKSIPYDYSIPSLAVDNHMITTLIHEGDTIYLDATEKYIGYGVYADRIQGRPTLIANKKDFILSRVPENKAIQNRVHHIDTIRIDIKKQMVTGKKYIIANGEEKTSLHNLYYRTPKQDQAKMLRTVYKKNNDYYVSNFHHQNFDDREKELYINYEYIAMHQSIHSDNSIYINLDLNPYLKSAENEKERKIEWVFPEKIDRTNEVYLNIPKGYALAYVPENYIVENPEFSIKVSFEKKENVLIYKKELLIPEGKISSNQLSAWHKALSELQDIYKNNIRLDIQ